MSPLPKTPRRRYTGPIGFQGYGIKGEPREVLTRTMAAWRQMQPAVAR